MLTTEQKHLTKKEMVNYGSYYTKQHLVDIVFELITSKVGDVDNYTILDSSCGYGSFLNHQAVSGSRKIGADIDKKALLIASQNIANFEAVNHNSLTSLSRHDYNISSTERLIVVGNPPYNDTTSIIRNFLKSEVHHEVHPKFKTRDLGISFLRSYVELDADIICVLHPLSYLIKKTNFNSLGEFTKRYKLVDSIIISSAEFNGTAPGKTYFPIVIGLYEKSVGGMNYEYINNFNFITNEGKEFSLNNMVSIKNFISKYPNQKWVREDQVVAKFWTMRDINALKRSKTFIEDTSYNTVFVDKESLPYYCYVDVFKHYIGKVPYYFGNCDVFIDHHKFDSIKDCFVALSADRHPSLEKFVSRRPIGYDVVVNNYFKDLLGKHYVEN